MAIRRPEPGASLFLTCGCSSAGCSPHKSALPSSDHQMAPTNTIIRSPLVKTLLQAVTRHLQHRRVIAAYQINQQNHAVRSSSLSAAGESAPRAYRIVSGVLQMHYFVIHCSALCILRHREIMDSISFLLISLHRPSHPSNISWWQS